MAITLATPLSEIALSPGSAITLTGLSWPHYQALLAELGENRATRLAYSDGVLELRMPSQLHEIISRLLSKIIFALAEQGDREIVDLGSTTWNRVDLAKGIEPDGCFLIQNAQRMPGLNPTIPPDLAPDLVIEVDIASTSEKKLAIYQAFGVPELWIYRNGQIHILIRQDGQFYPAENSLAFPTLSALQLQTWITLRATTSDLAVIKAVRQFNPS